MSRPVLASIRAALLSALIALAAAGSAAGAELRPFDARSIDAIRAAHQGKAFVLAFWATDCAPCRQEMALWKSITSKYPRFAIILVATDPPSQDLVVSRFLAHYDPGPVEHWAFADDFAERVRYAVDRSWRGELPRTYLFDAEHHAEAKSGLLDPHWLESWIARQPGAARKNAMRAAKHF